VVTVHGAEEIDGQVGVWMEFVRGRSLERLLADHGPFSAEEAASIGLDLCRALGAVHQAGLLHRDIKAHNVMRDDSGRVVLMDFGSGMSRAEPADLGSRVAGTPLYAAPEVLEGEAATVRNEIYSLGVLLYHLVTGSYPVEARSTAEVREAHRSGRRAELRDARPDLPDGFIQAVDQCLAADPDDRFESVAALEAALALLQAPHTTAPHRWRRVWLVATAAGGLLAASLWWTPGLQPWRDRALGRSSGGSTDSIPAAHSTTVRKVAFAFPYFTLGRPSYDGQYLSYVTPDGNIGVCELATGRTRSVTVKDDSGEQAGDSAVSPDGRQIVYAWFAPDGSADLRIIDTNGGPSRALFADSDVTRPSPVQWSRDGRHILALLGRDQGVNDIALIDVDTGSRQVLVTMQGVAPHDMSLSPDGRYVVYDRPEDQDAVSRDVFIVATDGSLVRPLVEHPANDVFPTWTPSGDAVFFSSDRSGGMDVWMLPVSDGRAVGPADLLKRDVGRMTPLGLTAAGDYYYQLQVRMVDVYSMAIDPSSGLALGDPVPLSSRFVGQNISPEWSADGSSVMYVSMRGLVPNDRNSRILSIVNFDSGEHRDFVPALSFFIRPRWSPDGRTVLVKGLDYANRWGIHRFDLQTGGVEPAILPGAGEGDGSIGDFDWSADGRQILYERGGHGVVARDLANGAETLVFDYRADSVTRVQMGGGFQVSPDGRWLAVSAHAPDAQGGQGTTVLKVQPLGGRSVELVRAERPEWITFAGWSRDSHAVLFRKFPGREPTGLWRVPVTGGEPQALGLEAPALRDVRMRADGRRLAFTAGFGDSEIWVMQRFLPETAPVQ
jgi:Tol biopolymer transport system component/tRNA A-37 threonylcarbamoyl transferase component Bud32